MITEDTCSIRYGKAVDFSKLKQGIMGDVGAAITRIRQAAEHFYPRATRALKACPLCRSTDIHPFANIYDYPYFKCQRCALVFLQKRVPPETLVEYWELGVASGTYADPATYAYRLEDVARPKVEFVLEHWDSPPGRWLDLGCGIGDALVVAKEKGWDIVGLEVSGVCCEFAKSRLKAPVLR